MTYHGKSRRRIFACAITLALATSAACGEEGINEPTADPPIPGFIVVTLSTPAQDDGAALFSITGPGLSTLQTANANYHLAWRLVSGNEARILMVGDLASGPVVTIQVSDVRRVSAYSGTAIEVSDRTGALRSAVSDRTLSFSTGSVP